MTKYSRIRAVLYCGHNGPEGKPHGHTYEVWAKFRFGPDARILQKHLQTVVTPMLDTFLPDELACAENLAEHILKQLPGCLNVELVRGPEGFVGGCDA